MSITSHKSLSCIFVCEMTKTGNEYEKKYIFNYMLYIYTMPTYSILCVSVVRSRCVRWCGIVHKIGLHSAQYRVYVVFDDIYDDDDDDATVANLIRLVFQKARRHTHTHIPNVPSH